MGEDPGTGRATVNESANETQDPEQLRAEIEETRRELGETVAALSAKTDVKAQAKERLDDAKASVNEKKDELVGKKDELLGKAKEISPDSALSAAQTGSVKARENPLPLAAAGAFLVGFLVGRLTARD